MPHGRDVVLDAVRLGQAVTKLYYTCARPNPNEHDSEESEEMGKTPRKLVRVANKTRNEESEEEKKQKHGESGRWAVMLRAKDIF